MKTQNPVIGRAKGSAGGMTAAKVYNKNVLRAKAMEVNNPRTTAQVTQRNFFAQVQGIASTVTNEQLRSLFGIKPKAMSRRNALAAQIAKAYSIVGNTKSVDFSKLGTIGNGDKVTTPYVQFDNGMTSDQTVITRAMLNVKEGQDPSLILVAFDTTHERILLINTSSVLSDEVSTANVVDADLDNFTGFAFLTCDSKGEDVSEKGFGSFIIKVRAEKKGSAINKGSTPDDVNITLSGEGPYYEAELDFSNYDFNNLTPGEFRQGDSEMSEPLVYAGSWVQGADNKWTAQCEGLYNANQPHFIYIQQGNSIVGTVNVTVTVE